MKQDALYKAIEENGYVEIGSSAPFFVEKRLKEDYGICVNYSWNIYRRGCWRCVIVDTWENGEDRLFMIVHHANPADHVVGKEHMVEFDSCEPHELKKWFCYFNWLAIQREK